MLNEIQQIGEIIPKATQAIAKFVEPESVAVQLRDCDLVETSSFTGKIADEEDIARLITIELYTHFPQMSRMVFSDIVNLIKEQKWPLSRVQYAVRKMEMEYMYPTFQTARFMQIDKRITFGRTEIALRRKLKFDITQNEIVVVKLARKYTNSNDVECSDWMRAYAYKEEAEDIMPNRIIGRWDDVNKCFKFTDELFFDHTIEERQQRFKKSTYPFCDCEPYNGKYPVEVVRSFYERFSEVLPPGDTLLFETYFGFNIETWLDNYYKRYLEKKELTKSE